jgi:hypothetical protein
MNFDYFIGRAKSMFTFASNNNFKLQQFYQVL